MTTQRNNAANTPALVGACDTVTRQQRSKISGDSEDARQEACLRALELQEPGAVRDPVRYVLRIARNLLIDRRRRAGREARIFEYGEGAASQASDALDPERILGGKQALEGIMAAIDALPPRCREAFLLHRFDNLSYPAIGRRMGISVSMVEKHIAEAMARLSRSQKMRTDQP